MTTRPLDFTVCSKCGGCRQIANDDEGAPWQMWEELPPASQLAVHLGLVQPLPCPECSPTLSDYERGASDERARIAWWLRASVSGPAAVTTGRDVLDALRELADVIIRHPERFHDAPPRRAAS